MKLLAFYPYRKGFVRGNTTYFPRDTMESFERIVAQMAEQSGAVKFEGTNFGNHTCYVVKFDYGVIRAFMFTDSLMIMGDRVDIGNW